MAVYLRLVGAQQELFASKQELVGVETTKAAAAALVWSSSV